MIVNQYWLRNDTREANVLLLCENSVVLSKLVRAYDPEWDSRFNVITLLSIEAVGVKIQQTWLS